MLLIGRDAEMHAIDDVLPRGDGTGGGSLVVVGARGSGKTSLLRYAQAAAVEGAPVARVDAGRPGGAGPSALSQLTAGLQEGRRAPPGGSTEAVTGTPAPDAAGSAPLPLGFAASALIDAAGAPSWARRCVGARRPGTSHMADAADRDPPYRRAP